MMISSSPDKPTFQKGIKYFTLDAVEKIENVTIGPHSNENWLNQKHVIIASKAHNIKLKIEKIKKWHQSRLIFLNSKDSWNELC